MFAEGWKSISTAVLTKLPHYSSFSSLKNASSFRCVGFQSFSGRLLEVLSALLEREKAQVTTNTGTVLGEKDNFLIILCIFNYRTQNLQMCCNHVPWLHMKCLISPKHSCGFHGAAFATPEQLVHCVRGGKSPQGSPQVFGD